MINCVRSVNMYVYVSTVDLYSMLVKLERQEKKQKEEISYTASSHLLTIGLSSLVIRSSYWNRKRSNKSLLSMNVS
jgi:hypothetical protein